VVIQENQDAVRDLQPSLTLMSKRKSSARVIELYGGARRSI
jgi:hypothetical protein